MVTAVEDSLPFHADGHGVVHIVREVEKYMF